MTKINTTPILAESAKKSKVKTPILAKLAKQKKVSDIRTYFSPIRTNLLLPGSVDRPTERVTYKDNVSSAQSREKAFNEQDTPFSTNVNRIENDKEDVARVMPGTNIDAIDDRKVVSDTIDDSNMRKSSEKLASNSGIQRHLTKKFSTQIMLTNRRSLSTSTTSPNLKRKLKHRTAKLRSEIPKKSEIEVMFERFSKKKLEMKPQNDVKSENLIGDMVAQYNEKPPHTARNTVNLNNSGNNFSNGKNNPENSDNFHGNLPVFNRSKIVDYDLFSPSDLTFSECAKKASIGDTVVSLPNQTLRKTQSDEVEQKMRPKEKSSAKKERGKKKELMSWSPITSFFKKEDKMTQRDYKGESNSIDDKIKKFSH